MNRSHFLQPEWSQSVTIILPNFAAQKESPNYYRGKQPYWPTRGKTFAALASSGSLPATVALRFVVMRLSSGILTALQLPLSTVTRDPCASLATLPPIPGVRITSSVRYPAGSNITTGADTTCSMPYQENAVEICRVQGVITTSSTSSVKFDMWLPDVWYGRLLFTGNGGLGGCKCLG